MRPLKAAQCNAVKSPSLVALTSTPASMRSPMASSAMGWRDARGVFVQCPHRPQPAAAIIGVVPSFDVSSGRAPAASRRRRTSPVELCVLHPLRIRPGPGLVANAATHSAVAPATSPVPVPNVSYAPFRTNPCSVTTDAVMRALGSAPRASRAFTSGSRSSKRSRPARAPEPPCLRFHAFSQVRTGPAAACSAVTPSTAPFGSAPRSSRKWANAPCPTMTA